MQPLRFVQQGERALPIPLNFSEARLRRGQPVRPAGQGSLLAQLLCDRQVLGSRCEVALFAEQLAQAAIQIR